MRYIFLILFVLISVMSFGQNRYYTDPVKIPMLLSGSFAELRSNHFHSGIDIKTQGVTGIPVYSVANGYISRIAVSPTGFGKALYIIHPNGTTSVYAHLKEFSPEVEKYVKDKQYAKKSFKTNLYPSKYLFSVTKGEEIAKSGNSGGSGGPHLHFEIRDSKTEEPINPLQFNFPVTDNIAPKIFSLLIVPLSEKSHVNYSNQQKSYPVVFYDGKYHLKNNPVIPVNGEIGFAVQANDYFNGTYNKCGINSLQLNVDDITEFTFNLNRFAFHESRFINSHIVYDEYTESKRRFIKTWIDPGNKLRIYNYNFSNGVLNADGENLHEIEIELKDTDGNSSVLIFNVQGVPREIQHNASIFVKEFKYNTTNSYSTDDFQLEIPKGALYKNLDFKYSKQSSAKNFYTDYHIIHNKKIPLHKSITVKLKAANLEESLRSKVVLANVDLETEEFYASGGEYKNGWVESKISSFGVYTITVDTIQPTISSLSIKDNTLTEANRIRFKIEDDLTGIKKIEGLIDGKWALFDYDPKNKKITHYFDAERFELNKQHDFKLTVTDYRGNRSVYEATFWK
ncbi:MAG: M23 family metallopeptidase [Bacteroidota bacterium]